jgi:SOS response regulatory protein OraA/RecX
MKTSPLALPEAGDETRALPRHCGQKKFGELPAQTPEERAKQMRFLQYRGFSGDAIRQTMRRAMLRSRKNDAPHSPRSRPTT